MGLLAEYGSDSGSDEEQIAGPSVPPPPPPASTSKPQVKKRAAVKIGLDLKPRLGEDEEDEDRVVPGDSRKKPRLGDAGGKGKSALLDMLPPPKRSLPASKTGPSTGASTVGNPIGGADVGSENESDTSKQPTTSSLLPPSLRNKAGKSKAPTQAAEIDFFGLVSSQPSTSKVNPSMPPQFTISIRSAPEVADYVPPPPTAEDPYPGYYQLPSGSWAAYEPEYYMSFFKEEEGPVGKDWDKMAGMEKEGMESIDVQKRMKDEKKLIEERKKLTGGQNHDDESNYKPIGKTAGVAGQRHQLTALLKDAHMNRSQLEATIATNKRNKRESGKKYGF